MPQGIQVRLQARECKKVKRDGSFDEDQLAHSKHNAVNERRSLWVPSNAVILEYIW